MKQIKITCEKFARRNMLSMGAYYNVAIEGDNTFLIINRYGDRIIIPKDKCEIVN